MDGASRRMKVTKKSRVARTEGSWDEAELEKLLDERKEQLTREH